jgi:hypothetical protein
VSDIARSRRLAEGEKFIVTLPNPIPDVLRQVAENDYQAVGTLIRTLIVEALRARGEDV